MHTDRPRQTRIGPLHRCGTIRVLIALIAVWGCATTPDPAARRQSAAALAREGGFHPAPLPAAPSQPGSASELPVAAWIKPGSAPGCVRVYLEGDGLAWQSLHRASSDPTPVDPIGLRLALADDSTATLVYLARPCQFGGATTPPCRPLLWTRARYGEEILRATNERLDGLLAPLDADDLTLFGFSGGGVVATLLAARRQDVDRLVTIAAPLDPAEWTRVKRVSPLDLSLSPMDEIDALQGLSQDHFVGLGDERVPASVGERFQRALGPGAPSRLHRVEAAGHLDWPALWSGLLDRLSPLCGDARDTP
jgi:hypothetical protein